MPDERSFVALNGPGRTVSAADMGMRFKQFNNLISQSADLLAIPESDRKRREEGRRETCEDTK